MRAITAVIVAALVLGVAHAATAQAPRPAGSDEERERAFVESLRREDAADADRYVALRDARAQATAELRRVEAQYNGAGPELRGLFLRSLRQAQRKYAETSLALLDFFDGLDRRTIARYQEEIARITKLQDERNRNRAELQKLLPQN